MTYKLVPLSGECGTQLVDGREREALALAHEIADREQARVLVFRNNEPQALAAIDPRKEVL